MNKIIFALSLSIFVGNVLAQNKKTTFGIKVGVNTSYFSGNSNWKNERAESFQAGALIERKINNCISMRTEFLYTNKGSSTNIIVVNQNIEPLVGAGGGYRKAILSYLEMPINAKLSFGKIVKPYYMLGVSPSLLLNSRLMLIDRANNTSTTNSFSANTFDIGILNTIGIEANTHSIIPFLELRINNGILKINSYGIRNNQVSLSAGLRF